MLWLWSGHASTRKTLPEYFVQSCLPYLNRCFSSRSCLFTGNFRRGPRTSSTDRPVAFCLFAVLSFCPTTQVNHQMNHGLQVGLFSAQCCHSSHLTINLEFSRLPIAIKLPQAVIHPQPAPTWHFSVIGPAQSVLQP